MTGLPIRKPHRVERFPPVALAVRGYQRWKMFNRVLWWMSAAALSRAILYTRNTSDSPTPRGLDLLPSGVLLGFGALWLIAGLLGLAGAVARDGAEMWGRRVLAGMFMAWAFIYLALGSYYSDGGTFKIAALFYGILALVTFASKPEVRYVNLIVATDAADKPAGRKGRRFLIVDRRRTNVPVPVERRRNAEG